jgi:hypothetical protein
MRDKHIDLTTNLERLEVFEDRLGVRLEALSCFLDEYGLTVNGEAHAVNGTALGQDTSLVVAAYDDAGRIVASTTHDISADDFFGLDTFEIILRVPVNLVTRVRVYPKKI